MLLQPKHSCWNAGTLIYGLGGRNWWSAGRKRPLGATPPPFMETGQQRDLLANLLIYHLSFAHWCRRLLIQWISNFFWLTLSVLFYVGSACQADGQSFSVPISGTYRIHNFWPKYSCSICIIKIPPPHNP